MYGEITGGNYQEWQAGVDLRFPVGLRVAGLAIANAKLNVKRERADPSGNRIFNQSQPFKCGSTGHDYP